MHKIINYGQNALEKNSKLLQFCMMLLRPAYGRWQIFVKWLLKKHIKFLHPILILKTPAASCALSGGPEIHSLISHRHMYSYILAIKSFLRFYNDVSVVVHDDGSLTKTDKNTLKKHIKNIRIIDRYYADEKINKMLASYPNCRRYRDEYVNSLQLFDFIMLCESEKIVSLDSDILFFKRPDTLIEWLCHGQEVIHFWEQEPLGTREFLNNINLGDCFIPMCICLVCFYRDAMNLDLLEQILSDVRKFDWWTGQSVYPVLLKKQNEKHKLTFFEPSQYQDGHGFKNGQTLRHYWLSRGTGDRYLFDMGIIIKELRNGSNTDSCEKVQ